MATTVRDLIVEINNSRTNAKPNMKDEQRIKEFGK